MPRDPEEKDVPVPKKKESPSPLSRFLKREGPPIALIAGIIALLAFWALTDPASPSPSTQTSRTPSHACASTHDARLYEAARRNARPYGIRLGRNVVRQGRAKDGACRWTTVRAETRRIQTEKREAARYEGRRWAALSAAQVGPRTAHRMAVLVRASNALPVGRKSADGTRWLTNPYNVALIRLMVPGPQGLCLLGISKRETVDSIEHRVGHGFRWNDPKAPAYGIPQSNPPYKMASHGPDWRTNPVVQIAWMYDYTMDPRRYGSPCAAYAHHLENHSGATY